MKGLSIRIFAIFAVLVLLTGCISGCATDNSATINGIELSAYTIVYADDAPDYCQRAAEYIQAQILERTGVELPVCKTSTGTYAYEIVVGETNRTISQILDPSAQELEFAIMADENHIALEGDYFIIAAAAYYFAETYITGENMQATIPQQAQVLRPTPQPATHFLFLIGDGMGINHTNLFSQMKPSGKVPFYDNEDIFYGYLLPYQGVIQTESLTGVTDSAAAATALACGYKTYNSYVGRNADGNDVMSLTELAASKGMATAVMSTDKMVGATPAGFSSHAMDRDDSTEISEGQKKLIEEQGTLIHCNLDGSKQYQKYITDALEQLDASENGFFMMYEEGHIDKHSHKNQLQDTFDAVIRFNQAIGVFMEYAFYHPDTFVVITADHETGGLTLDGGSFVYQTEDHTGVNVPIFAYGCGAEVFDGYNAQNNEVPKVIAGLWGVSDFGAS